MLLYDVISHENQSQHHPDPRCVCLELSGRISAPDGLSYHTGRFAACRGIVSNDFNSCKPRNELFNSWSILTICHCSNVHCTVHVALSIHLGHNYTMRSA